jgi:putative transposase
VKRFRTRKLEGNYPYIWLDATFLKVRQDHRVVNMAVVIAVGLNAATGQREVLGVDIGPIEDGAFWLRFLRELVTCGLTGVQLVISDSHQGLKGAIAAVLQGAGWQRCRTHLTGHDRPGAHAAFNLWPNSSKLVVNWWSIGPRQLSHELPVVPV